MFGGIRDIKEALAAPVLVARLLAASRRPADPELAEEETVVYGPGPRQRVLVFHPGPRAPLRPGPIVAFLHGGGWSMGSPELFRFIGRFFAARGFSAFLPGFRLAPRHKYPAQLADVKAGLAAGMAAVLGRRDPAATESSRPRLALIGQSAGAQLAVIAAAEAARARGGAEQGASPEGLPAVDGLALLSGVLNFSLCQNHLVQHLIWQYVAAADWDTADPVRRAPEVASLPVLCIHGSADPLVEPENSLSFAAAVNACRPGQARVVLAEGMQHADFSLFLRWRPETDVLLNWLEDLAAR